MGSHNTRYEGGSMNYIQSEIYGIKNLVRWGANRDGKIPAGIYGTIVLRAPDGYATKYLSVSLKAIEAIETIIEADYGERSKREGEI